VYSWRYSTVSSEPGIDTARFGRTLALIGFVTAVFLALAANRLEGDVFKVGAVAIGSVALVTATIGFLVAAGSAVGD
jgi:hypothetical protein